KFFRKTYITTLPNLGYLDRPIFDLERTTAKAWKEGGAEAEAKARATFVQNEHDERRRTLQEFRDWQSDIRAKKQEELKRLRAAGDTTTGYFDLTVPSYNATQQAQAQADALEESTSVQGEGIENLGKVFWSSQENQTKDIEHVNTLPPPAPVSLDDDQVKICGEMAIFSPLVDQSLAISEEPNVIDKLTTKPAPSPVGNLKKLNNSDVIKAPLLHGSTENIDEKESQLQSIVAPNMQDTKKLEEISSRLSRKPVERETWESLQLKAKAAPYLHKPPVLPSCADMESSDDEDVEITSRPKTREELLHGLRHQFTNLTGSYDNVDVSRKRMKNNVNCPTHLEVAFQYAYEKTQAAVNSVLQKANHACYQQVLEYFVERSSVNRKLLYEQEHLVPLQPFPVAAIVAGTDASAASSAVWTDPLIRHLKRRFPFVVSIQRKYTNGRQMLEFIANTIFQEIHQREREGQWLQNEMRRATTQSITRRSGRVDEYKPDTEVPVIKWDTVAGILEQLTRAVTPIIQMADDVSIQAEMLVMELRTARELQLGDCVSRPFSIHQECFERLVEDSKDRINSLRRSIGIDTFTENLLLQLHRELLELYIACLEAQLAVERVDTQRHVIRHLMQSLIKETGLMAPDATTSTSGTTPTILLVLDQYESVSESVFGDVLHMWKDHAKLLRLGCILGLTSLSSPCYRRMPLRIATCLVLRPFVLEDSLKCFHDIIQTLVISGECPVICSGAVLTWLYIGFTKTHSISVFLQSMRCLLYRHFTLKSHALLNLLPLTNVEYQHPFRLHCQNTTLPVSVVAYLDGLSPAERSDLQTKVICTGNASLKDTVVNHLGKVPAWKRVWQTIWSCVELTYQVVRKSKRGEHEVHLLAAALDGTLLHTKYMAEIKAFLLQAGVKLLWTVVQEWRQCLDTYAMDLIAGETNTLEAIVQQVDETKQIVAFMQSEMNDEENVRMLPQVRIDIIDLFMNGMVVFLSPALPEACVLGTLFYYNDVKGLEEMFEASHFESIQAALCKPIHALEKDLALSTTSKRQVKKMIPETWCNDMQLIYRFYRDTAGMLINMAEWLEYFENQVQGEASKNKAGPIDSKYIQVRFLRGLSTLRYLGFLRKYGKSEDYMEKLVFI
ncbi:hypothetical protein THRCLA_11545, partial [Thraustotheca clavata]